MLVVSSHEAGPAEQFQKLSQEQHRIQHSGEYTYPKWFIPNTLKYYVLLHDVSDGDEKRFGSQAPVQPNVSVSAGLMNLREFALLTLSLKAVLRDGVSEQQV